MPKEYAELRYCDCPSVEADIHISAPAARVFEMVSDINLPARFSSEFRAARWLDGDGTPSKGARFVGTNFHPAAGEWETTCIVVDYEPPRVFAYAVVGLDGDTSSTWNFTVEPDGAGSKLTQHMQMGPGRSFINLAIDAMPEKESRILHRRLHEHVVNMEANLEGVKALLESPE
jgi:uncharacterized protein YndB with AHSA1/START domain